MEVYNSFCMTTNRISAIQKRVMRRVYAIFLYRMVARPRTLKVSVLLLSFTALLSLISFPNVVSNVPGDPLQMLSFFTSAFLETEIIVQTAFLLFVGFLVWLLPDLFHTRTTQMV